MSEIKHTPEPWVQNTLMIVAPNGGRGQYGGLEVAHTGLVGRNRPGEQAEADAERIVACVNACAGMENPSSAIAELQAENARLREELAMWKPLTPEEATAALDAIDSGDCPAINDAEIERVMSLVSDPTYRPDNPTWVKLLHAKQAAEQRAERAELLVRLQNQPERPLAIGGNYITIFERSGIGPKVKDVLVFEGHTNGIPDLTDDQWERLDELERGGT